jgi:hypothetical protein
LVDRRAGPQVPDEPGRHVQQRFADLGADGGQVGLLGDQRDLGGYLPGFAP